MSEETHRPHRDAVSSLTWEQVKNTTRSVNRREASIYSFEFIQHDVTRFFADIDLKYTDLSEEEYNRIKANFFDTMKKNSVVEDFVITDGSYYSPEQAKISAHIVFRKRYIKKKTFQLKSETGKKLIDRIIRGVDDYSTIAAAFDQQVYGKMCWLRFPYGIAHDKPNIHYPVDKNAPPCDYMVSLIPKESVFLENQDDEEEEEAPKKKRKNRDDLEEELAKRMPTETVLALVDCLNAKKRANSGYENWFRLACVLYNTLPYNVGYEKFVEISEASEYKDFDEKHCDQLFSSLSPREDALGERTLVRWAREDNAFKASIALQHEEKYKVDIVITSSNHLPRVKEIVAWLNQPLLRIVRDSKSKSIYVRESNTWDLYNEKVKKLEAYFPTLPFTIGGLCKDELKVMSKDGRWMRQNVWQYIDSFLPDIDIEKEFITSTYLKLCFKNGVYDCVKKTFTPWEENNNVFSAVCIDYDYRPSSPQKKKEAHEILEGILGSDVDNHLRRFSQMIAGFVGKLFNLSKAGRDSGRTQITGILKELFGDYVQSFGANSFTTSAQGNTTEASLQMGFMLPIRWCRIAASNEIQVSNGILLDSPKIKMACGGDPINARAVHGKHTTAFIHNTSFIIMANAFPKATESDVYRSIYQLEFPYTFISQEEYKESGYEENPNPFIKQRVENFAQTLFPAHRYGLLACILDAFTTERCVIEQLDANGDVKTDDSEVQLVDRVFNDLIFSHFKKDSKSEISTKIYQDFLDHHSELLPGKSRSEILSKLKLLGKPDRNVKLKDEKGEILKDEKGNIKRGRGFKGIKFIEHPDDCPLCKGKENLPE